MVRAGWICRNNSIYNLDVYFDEEVQCMRYRRKFHRICLLDCISVCFPFLATVEITLIVHFLGLILLDCI